MNERVTMAVIAKRAGVHTTTVSLALRNHPSLPVTTRTRLQALAAEMGYHPDPALSALVAYRRQTRPLKQNPLLAYVTNWDSCWGWKSCPAHRDFHEGARRRASELGYQLDHFWLREKGLTHRRLSRILYSRGIAGVLLASHLPGHDGPLDFDWSKFSGVKIDFAPRDQPLHTVTNDQRSIVSLAIQRARAAGYRRIGFVMPHWWDEFVEYAWSAGILTQQQRWPRAERLPIFYYETPANSQASLAGNIDVSAPRPAFARWLSLHRPDVVLSYGPFALPTLRDLGYEIPRDLAYADIFLESADGRTAGVRQNCQRVGALAIDVVSQQIQQNVRGVPEIPTITMVEGTWQDGASLPLRMSAELGGEPASTGGADAATAGYGSSGNRDQQVAV